MPPRGQRRGATSADQREALHKSGLTAGNHGGGTHQADARVSGWSLHSEGFSAERFVEVIETEAVWELRDLGSRVPAARAALNQVRR